MGIILAASLALAGMGVTVVTPDGALVFRVTITAVSGKQSTVASRFLAAYLKELRINNIPIAWEGAPNEY